MLVPAFLNRALKKIFRSPFSDGLFEFLKELERRTLAPLTDDELLSTKFRIEADLESLKYRGILFSVLPIMATIFTLLVNSFTDSWKYFMIIVLTIFVIGLVELFGNFIPIHRDATLFLKVIDDEIEKRSREKEERESRMELRKERLKEKYSAKR